MNAWSWAWVALTVAAVLLEVVAIAREGDDDTLSEQVWNLQEWLLQHGKAGAFARVGLVIGFTGFVGWLVLHFFTGAV